jgi:hypothetical protein
MVRATATHLVLVSAVIVFVIGMNMRTTLYGTAEAATGASIVRTGQTGDHAGAEIA